METPSGPNRMPELRLPERFEAFLQTETISGHIESAHRGLGREW